MDALSVSVQKTELVTKILANRDQHRTVFLEAVEGFREELLGILESRVDQVKAGNKVSLYIQIPEPEDHTADYDRVISMLSMHTDDIITIDSQDFARYVMDDWEWKRKWVETTSNYTNRF